MDSQGWKKGLDLWFTESDEKELDRIERYLRREGILEPMLSDLMSMVLKVAFKKGKREPNLKKIYSEVKEENELYKTRKI